jgi:hypothetical protein
MSFEPINDQRVLKDSSAYSPPPECSVSPNFFNLTRENIWGLPHLGHHWKEHGFQPGDRLLYYEQGQYAAVVIHPDSMNNNFVLVVTLVAVFATDSEGKLHLSHSGPLAECVGKKRGVFATHCYVVPGVDPEDQRMNAEPLSHSFTLLKMPALLSATQEPKTRNLAA